MCRCVVPSCRPLAMASTASPSPDPKVQELSPVALKDQVAYDGPTGLDQGIVAHWQPEPGLPGLPPRSEPPSQLGDTGWRGASSPAAPPPAIYSRYRT